MSDIYAAWAASRHRAVIFDFNGTLSNDEPILLPLFQEIFREHLGWDMSAEEYFENLAGRSDREIIEAAVSERSDGGVEFTQRLLEIRRDRYLELVAEQSPIEDGAVALVELLVEHAIPLGIVTGAQRIDVEAVLEHRHLRDAFSVVVTEEDVIHGKPDPEGFLKGASLLGVLPVGVLVFEDSIFGAMAARTAGMKVVGITGTTPTNKLAPEVDAMVDSLSPLILVDALEHAATGPRG